MILRAMRVSLYAVGVGALLTGRAVLRWPGPSTLESSDGRTGPDGGVMTAPLSSESLAVLVARDPFRVSRAPAQLWYDPIKYAEPPAPEEPKPPKPVLVLSGILWGPDPSAVLEGVPGIAGPRLVRAGDTLGGLTIRRVREKAVEVKGYDTTWVLGVREPW
jgi:hypothetical protein